MNRYSKYRYLCHVCLFSLFSVGIYSQKYYVKTTNPTIKTNDFSIINYNNSIVTYSYFDEFGSPVGKVQQGYTPLKKDLVTKTVVNDPFGEFSENWLPTPTSVDDGAYKEVSSIATGFYNDSRPYNESVVYSKQSDVKGPGNAWVNKPVKTYEYLNNTEVHRYSVNSSNQLIHNGYYDPQTLSRTYKIDEDSKTMTEYKDKLGQVVMTRMSVNVNTYYVYNGLGQLAYVLPPLASDALGSVDAVNKYGYIYQYDERGNCNYKKLPGSEPIIMVYDLANRLILSQDGNQRTRLPKQWTINKYDIHGRLLYTGIINREVGESEKQIIHNNLVIEAEGTVNQLTNTGYTCNFFIGAVVPLTVYYYDDYQFLQLLPLAVNTSLTYLSKTGYSNKYTSAKGLKTGSRTYELSNPTNFTTTSYYYNDKSEIVQTRSTNFLGGYDFAYNDLDFTGKPNKTLTEHSIAGQVVKSELYTYTYDHAGRVLLTNHSYISGATTTSELLSSNTYDELGRLVTKKCNNNNEIDEFEYNIRNWITKIKNGTFEENIYYNTTSSVPSSAPLYNGNISSIIYKYDSWDTFGYKFSYDALNRLTLSNIYRSPYTKYFARETFIYDKQGNVSNLTRGSINANGILTTNDSLTMTYIGNQVTSIADAMTVPSTYGIREYQNKANTTNEFTYDANGNMVKDLDRNIVTIRYNFLNLPDTVQFGNGNQIVNRYDASGQKLSTRYFTRLVPVVVNPGETKQWTYTANSISDIGTYYVGNREYKFNGATPSIYTIDKIYNAEGYMAAPFTLKDYYYYRKDHLGNNCEVINKGNTAGYVQRVKYFSSGIPLPSGYGDGISLQSRKFNGKEFIEMHGYDMYDYEARGYYPAIMRFTTPDPHAENFYTVSPYAYCSNNPVNKIDPTGMDEWDLDSLGNVVNHVVTDKHDAFYVVDANSNRVDGKSRTYAYGTVKDYGTKTADVVDEETGEAKSYKYDYYSIEGDDKAKDLFEFLANPGATTKVEWTRLAYGEEGSKGMNNLTTTHQKKMEAGGMSLYYDNLQNGANVRIHIHNHPGGTTTPGVLDRQNAALPIQLDYPDAKMYLYTVPQAYKLYYGVYPLKQSVIRPK